VVVKHPAGTPSFFRLQSPLFSFLLLSLPESGCKDKKLFLICKKNFKTFSFDFQHPTSAFEMEDKDSKMNDSENNNLRF